MSEYFPKSKSLGENLKVELYLSNYATKADWKNATGVAWSDFAKKTDIADLKSEVDESFVMIYNFLHKKKIQVLVLKKDYVKRKIS